MGILDTLAKSLDAEVRIGDFTWRLRRATPRIMLDHGLPSMMLLKEIVDPAAVAAARTKAAAADTPAPSQGRPTNPAETDADRLYKQLLRTTKAQKDKAAQIAKHHEAMVCASVTHVRVDGMFEEGSEFEEGDVGGWLPVRVMPGEDQHDSARGRLWVGAMQPGTVDKLQAWVMKLSAPQEVEAALRRFRAKPEPTADASADVSDVREVAARVPGA